MGYYRIRRAGRPPPKASRKRNTVLRIRAVTYEKPFLLAPLVQRDAGANQPALWGAQSAHLYRWHFHTPDPYKSSLCPGDPTRKYGTVRVLGLTGNPEVNTPGNRPPRVRPCGTACGLLAAHRGQKARVRAAVFLDDLEATVIVQQPAECLRRVGVLEVHADVLAALQLDLFPRHGGRTVARRAEVARDQVESQMPRIRLVVEADLPVRVRYTYRCQQRREKLAGRRIVAPRHGLLGIVNFAVDD